jgi:hypothetical protein
MENQREESVDAIQRAQYTGKYGILSVYDVMGCFMVFLRTKRDAAELNKQRNMGGVGGVVRQMVVRHS